MAKGYIYEHVVTPRDVTDRSIAYDESYISWACTARERMVAEHLETRLRFLVGETYVRYITPAFLDDHVEIRVTVGDYNVGKGLVKLDFRFSNKASGQMLAEGYQVIFFSDVESGKRIPVPDDFLKLVDIGTLEKL
jgi:acyl-CoA thioesterase FadM